MIIKKGIVLRWTITYIIPKHTYNHINEFELRWRTLILLTAAYGLTLTYGGLVATGYAALSTALIAAQLVRMTRKYLQQQQVILTEIAQQLESL